MTKQKANEVANSGKSKKILFTVIMICLPFIILLSLELILQLAKYGENYKLFIDFPGEEVQKHRIVNPQMGKKYFQKLEYTKPCHDMFLKTKPENGFRIFVLGSSTVVGFPYDENLIFTRILQERLQDCYPEKKIEIINTAITAINSFTLQDYIDDILDEEPDAILIYAGHNEFYGALGIGSVEKINSHRGLVILHLDLMSLKLYQFLRNTITGVGKLIQGDQGAIRDSGTLMKVIVGNREIDYQSKTYQKGIESYRKNMRVILKKSQKKNIPVFISELVSNVKDLAPFCSSKSSENQGAADIYHLALENEKIGDYKNAKENYILAKDLDCIRFRASEDINETVKQLAGQFNAFLVPAKTIFEKASPNELIGNNLLTEHVHPNIDGYFLLADAFFNKIAGSKILGDTLNPVYYKNSAYYQKNWGYTVLDSLLGVHRVNSLKYHWPFQSLDAPFVNYGNIYKPISFIDSLAFEMFKTDHVISNEIHLQLAEYYKQKGDFYNAYKEYNAAIKCNPYQVKDYLEAANCLIKINDLSMALKFLEKSLEVQKTFFAYFKIGETLILKGEYKEAIHKFNQASELDINHENYKYVLLKKYHAYYLDNNPAKAEETLSELNRLYPDFKVSIPGKRMEYAYYIPKQIEKQINEGIGLYMKNNFEEALSIFLKTTEIRETSLANKYIGDILLKKNDKNALLYYRKAYPDYRKDPEFLYNSGLLYIQNNQIKSARNILNELKVLNPSYSNIILLEQLIVAYSE